MQIVGCVVTQLKAVKLHTAALLYPHNNQFQLKIFFSSLQLYVWATFFKMFQKSLHPVVCEFKIFPLDAQLVLIEQRILKN